MSDVRTTAPTHYRVLAGLVRASRSASCWHHPSWSPGS
jgi:hypothetical protein